MTLIETGAAIRPIHSSARTAGMVASSILIILVFGMEVILANALPVIQAELGLTPVAAASLLTVMTVVAALSAPILGKLGDRHGAIRIVRSVIPLVIIGGVLTAVGSGFGIMMAGAILQGVGGGLVPLFLAVVPRVVPPDRLKVVIGFVVGLTAAGTVAGTLLTVAIAGGASWHWLFAWPSIAGVVCGLIIWRFLPSDLTEPAGTRPGIDWAGTSLFAFSLVALMAGLVMAPMAGWLSAQSLIILALVVASTLGWLTTARRSPHPMVDLRMLKARGAWTAVALSVVLGAVTAYPFVVVPQLLVIPAETGYGLSASLADIASYLLPGLIIAMVIGPFAGILEKKIGIRAVAVIGMSLVLIAIAASIWLHDQPWQIYTTVVLFSVGTPAVMTMQFSSTLLTVAPDQIGVATGVNAVGRAVGFAVGGQVSATFLTVMFVPEIGLPAESAFTTSFAVLAGFAFAGLLFATAMPKRAAPEGQRRRATGGDVTTGLLSTSKSLR